MFLNDCAIAAEEESDDQVNVSNVFEIAKQMDENKSSSESENDNKHSDVEVKRIEGARIQSVKMQACNERRD